VAPAFVGETKNTGTWGEKKMVRLRSATSQTLHSDLARDDQTAMNPLLVLVEVLLTAVVESYDMGRRERHGRTNKIPIRHFRQQATRACEAADSA